MAVNIRCPNLKCREILKVPTSSRGQRVRCSYCKTILKVPLVSDKPKPTTATPVAPVGDDDSSDA